ncbi:MAG: putative cupin superfamily sugar epimerase [Candidatus Omnitrophota bacterium]|jgi:predicted cupin superfamily sugar epimerase
MNPLQKIITHLSLTPHPEGGYFKETYRSQEIIASVALPIRFKDARNMSTSILYLLESKNISQWHRILSDEIWYFHQGLPVELCSINEIGELFTYELGLSQNQTPQVLIPQGHWFAAKPIGLEGFSLMSCHVSPGFDFCDFELADIKLLQKKWPNHQKVIGHFSKKQI